MFLELQKGQELGPPKKGKNEKKGQGTVNSNSS
jgi:hypothetical protein